MKRKDWRGEPEPDSTLIMLSINPMGKSTKWKMLSRVVNLIKFEIKASKIFVD